MLAPSLELWRHIRQAIRLQMHMHDGISSAHSKAAALSWSFAAILHLKKSASAFEPWICVWHVVQDWYWLAWL
jgi:hypothetical protein